MYGTLIKYLNQLRVPRVITDTSGNTVLVGAGVAIATLNRQFPTKRIKIGSFGDSIADIGTVNNVTAQDLRRASASNTPVALGSEKFGAHVQLLSGGLITPVFNGGVGGETTTQIATRATAVSSMVSTSKAMIDAETFGAEYVIYSGGINDLTGLTTASSAADIETAVSTALSKIKVAINKAKVLGLYFIYHSVCPYGQSGSVTANQIVVNTASADLNARVKAVLDADASNGHYFNARQYVQASDGGWTTGYSTDGTHPNHAAGIVMYGPLADWIIAREGGTRYTRGLPVGKNLFSNADLSASTAGLATGIVLAVADGATTNTIESVNGVNVQQIDWAPGNANGVDSYLIVDIDVLAAGAAPFVALAVGDILGIEYDLEISNGAGGAPNIYELTNYLRKYVGATPTIYNNNFSTYSGTTTQYYLGMIDARVCGGFVEIDEATSASSGKISNRIVLRSQTQTSNVRLRISNIRCVKVATTY